MQSVNPQLYSWYLSYIGDGSSVSISEKLYAAEIFSLDIFKTFFNLAFAFEEGLCWSTPWILTGETPMLSRVELNFFFDDLYSKNHHLMLVCPVNSLSQ